MKEEVENVATVQDSSKYAHAEDYSWLKGQLQHFGGRWSLGYATLDQSDKYGGSVKLEEDHRLRQYKDRQFVHVKGFLDIRASRGGPVVYRMYTIEPHK